VFLYIKFKAVVSKTALSLIAIIPGGAETVEIAFGPLNHMDQFGLFRVFGFDAQGFGFCSDLFHIHENTSFFSRDPTPLPLMLVFL